MNAAEWLVSQGRGERVPADLGKAISLSLDESGDTGDATAQLVAGARKLTLVAMSAECSQRSGALPLLTLDALMTYAMEAGAESGSSTEEVADALLSVIREAADSV